MTDDQKVDLHELYARLDCNVLQLASDEAFAAGGEFWVNALNGLMQIRQKKLIESGKYYG